MNTNLLRCPPENHSLHHMIQHYGIDLKNKNVIFAGAHDGIEYDSLEHHNVARVDWFEANKYVFPHLKERIKDNPKHNAYFACLGKKDGEYVTFYSYRDKKDGASGLYKPDKFKDYIKDCPLTGEEWTLSTVTIDSYIEDIRLANYFLAVVDLQGAELDFFKGGNLLLKQDTLEWIICEVSHFSCYKDAPQATDIDEYLKGFGFENVGYREDWNLGQNLHGDNIYKRTHQ